MQIIAIVFKDRIVVYNLLKEVGSPSLLSPLGSHLLINLKEAGELGVNEGTNYRSRMTSNIEFAKGTPAAGSNSGGTSSV
ncbi:uncharacterized protein FOMMEDRAFT_156817 [Fomitiporia mediterranea MF3/22]|uniref:uncharacterized protein n=1 Tax=Fomitiporia mediterranea (strain MF3/22) TaxID=694068 RepID=UPI0004407277|nr:uncharacterized protein FOMMEDRAFT_156817 [Fomitiporia mediterranea MF3/22]EJD03411.1 hypothetical protein FOMMEDRAFT_156817 [Fomitiporia mediterranea MF3/22]